ncbi:ABC transporter substrate-binding protein [Halorussus halophilus]|uniref:ABC transporter substrate-binding protein n=1 Tax=Halorussus halophilus TaxID=2650975 RepID=UPI001301441A|nr:ABC transporter substrate-binding protein [Halorussus halophilus]
MGETRRRVLEAIGGTALGTNALASSVAGRQTEGVSLLLNWKPSGLHVPYYVAESKGFYDEEGVSLGGIESGQGSDFSAKQVGLGNTAFAVTSADQLLNVNSRGLSAQSVGVVMQRSPVVVFTTRETFGGELTSADQLAGKTVGTGPGMVRLLTKLLLERKGVRSDVTLTDTGFDTVQQLLAGKIDAAGGVFGDAVVARQKANAVSSIPVAEAIPSYGHVLATKSAFAQNNPETVRGFLRATARGAAWATDNPKRATDVLVSANPSLKPTRSVQREKWEQMAREYVLSNAVRDHGWGWSRPQPWATMHRALDDANLLGGAVEPNSVWTNEYLDPDAKFVGRYASQVEVER